MGQKELKYGTNLDIKKTILCVYRISNVISSFKRNLIYCFTPFKLRNTNHMYKKGSKKYTAHWFTTQQNVDRRHSQKRPSSPFSATTE